MVKKYLQNIVIGVITSVITVWSVVPMVASAQTRKATPAPKAAPAPPPNYGQALEIAPPVIYLTVNPGQQVKTQIFLRDISSGELIVTGEANDFTASGEDGTPKLILNSDAGDNPYTMKTWIVAPAELRLVPREVKTMQITINVPKDASPGGHYGLIRFTATPPALKSSGVSLSTSLGALMLVTVNGAVSEKLSVSDFSVNYKGKTASVFQSGPLNFAERIKNEGNIHEQPTGQVIIKDMFGRKVATLNINLPPRNILPASTRKFEQPLDKSVIGNKRLFGRYTASLTVNYGKNKQSTTSSLAFWVIPYRLIAIVILALIAGFFVLRYAIRRYNKYILGTSSRRRKK
jgi:hypothetical protein